MATYSGDETSPPVTADDISALTNQLNEWSGQLPPGERSVAQLLVQHARDLTPGDVQRKQLVGDIDSAVQALIHSMREKWKDVAGGVWVDTGPVWEKKNRVELGEEIEIVSRLFARKQTEL